MKKYQEALDILRINHKDICQQLNCDVLQELVDKETAKKPIIDDSGNLTLDWIISTLKKSGINSKQVVIDRLENVSADELFELVNCCHKIISNKIKV